MAREPSDTLVQGLDDLAHRALNAPFEREPLMAAGILLADRRRHARLRRILTVGSAVAAGLFASAVLILQFPRSAPPAPVNLHVAKPLPPETGEINGAPTVRTLTDANRNATDPSLDRMKLDTRTKPPAPEPADPFETGPRERPTPR